MKFTLGDKRVSVSLKPEVKEKFTEVYNNILDMGASLEDARPLESNADIEWNRVAYAKDKLLGICEIASLDMENIKYDNLIKLLSSLGFSIYEPRSVYDKIDLVGDVKCTKPDSSLPDCYLLISTVKGAYLDEDTLDRFYDEARILELKPVIIDPLGMDPASTFMAENYDIEVIDKYDIANIQRGIKDKATNNKSLASEIIKEVAKL